MKGSLASVSEKSGHEEENISRDANAGDISESTRNAFAPDLEAGIVPARQSPTTPSPPKLPSRSDSKDTDSASTRRFGEPKEISTPKPVLAPSGRDSSRSNSSQVTVQNVEAGIPAQTARVSGRDSKPGVGQAHTAEKPRSAGRIMALAFQASTIAVRESFKSPLMLLLPFVPAGFIINYTLGPSVPSFAVNLVAIIPLSKITGDSLRMMETSEGGTYSGFIYITSSNMVQLVSSIILLKSNEPDQQTVLRTNLIGGILSCLLLVLGGAMLFGGWATSEQMFNVTMSQLTSSCLMLGTSSLLTPTASALLKQTSEPNLVRQSRGIAVILFVVYLFLLRFEFKTHRASYQQPNWAVEGGEAEEGEQEQEQEQEAGRCQEPESEPERDPGPVPVSFRWYYKICMAVPFGLGVALLAFNVSFATDSIASIVEPGHLTPSFIGLILLPILNNDLEPFFMAKADKMDFVVQFTVGKCLQTALFVTPLIVFISWGQHIELALAFDGFEVLSLLLSILLLNFVASPGTSHWMKGVILLADWAMIAVASFYAEA